MVSFSTSDFKPGLKVLIDSDPCEIIEEEFVKPGKGQAFSKIKFRNLLSGRVGEKTCKVGESLESADIRESQMQYLYSEGQEWHFMDQKTFEQIQIPETLINAPKYLKEGNMAEIIFYTEEERPISCNLPANVILEISNTEPGEKGNTATNALKPATLETGSEIKVPLFINTGDKIKVDTSSGQYLERIKS